MENIPNKLDINNCTYSFKGQLKNGYYTYRCKFRSSCKIIIRLDINNIKKYLYPDNKEDIEYTITSS